MSDLFKWRVWVSPELKAFQRQFPSKVGRALGMVVNNVAFDMRDEMIKSIGRLMIIRQKGFVQAHMLVDKAKPGPNPVAEVGSIRRGHFEGWAAQQFGEPVDRTRVPTLMARRGDKRKAMTKASRLGPGKDVPTAKGIVGKSSPGAVIAMMRILARRGDKRPFLILSGEHPKFAGGLYEMLGRKDKRDKKARIRMLQSLDNPNTQPAPMDWVNPAWKAYQASKSIAGEWRKVWNLIGWRDVMKRG